MSHRSCKVVIVEALLYYGQVLCAIEPTMRQHRIALAWVRYHSGSGHGSKNEQMYLPCLTQRLARFSEQGL